MKFRKRIALRENSNEYITLYHNTPYKNIKSILQNGLSIDASTSEKASGWRMIWATTYPQTNGEYGGNIVKFRLPKDYRYEKVNKDQYIVFDNIDPDLIDGVDYMLGDDTISMLTSELPNYIDEYGKAAIRDVLSQHHGKEMSLDELKELTPELDWE